MDLDSTRSGSRRRGEALEGAILQAAWDQLTESGYSGFSYDAIAQRAQTSKPVLYRRWPSREALLHATIAWRGASDRLTLPETGSLRGDVLSLLREANRRPERFLALLSAQVGNLYAATGLTPRDVREEYLSEGPSVMTEIIARAIARGETDAEHATPRICAVPFDLFRAQLFMTLASLPDDELVAIVDDVFLPLISI